MFAELSVGFRRLIDLPRARGSGPEGIAHGRGFSVGQVWHLLPTIYGHLRNPQYLVLENLESFVIITK